MRPFCAKSVLILFVSHKRIVRISEFSIKIKLILSSDSNKLNDNKSETNAFCFDIHNHNLLER